MIRVNKISQNFQTSKTLGIKESENEVTARQIKQKDNTNNKNISSTPSSTSYYKNKTEINEDSIHKLSVEERQMLQKLRRLDRQVRAHERAHKRVGGKYTSMIRYEYKEGPNNRKYAVAGSIDIDTKPKRKSENNIEKMDIVKDAALAPLEPSNKDRQIARRAKNELRKSKQEIKRKSSKNYYNDFSVTNQYEKSINIKV